MKFLPTLLGWGPNVLLFLLSAGAALWFSMSLEKAWRIQGERGVACTLGDTSQNSYVQFEVFEQDPVEPIFRGNIVMLFAQRDVAEGTSAISVRTEAGNGYYGNLDEAKLVFQKGFASFVTPTPITTEFTRVSGSHRYFPFDSAQFEYGLRWNPQFPVKAVVFRNYNQSFYLPCNTFSIKTLKPGVLAVAFELRRNPLVQVAAVVLLSGAFIFVAAIVFFVKTGSLPTAIASCFFSLWSIRSILSSEMKIFPTLLDIAILCLAVTLVVAVGIRIAIQNRPKQKSKTG
jgi:hypothetical protein